MAAIDDYPDLKDFLDPTDDYQVSTQEVTSGGQRYLVVTEKSESDAGQLLFRITDKGLQLEKSDNAVSIGPSLDTLADSPNLVCRISDQGDIDAVFNEAVNAFERGFSSADGPDGGNLACVWAVRHIAKQALGRWITRTDGTAVFDPELKRCFGSNLKEADVPAGGIIISPTEGRNIGHVGIMGPVTGDDKRLIYSNSSSAAIWKQNFTLKTWVERYRDRKGLKVHFYPIPNYT
ncbi:hypothetical protein [Rhizobium leguminosarum]|uniref:CHAP domain-containing protein n=1 Tax=Rhizobium leguminosarum TaxID=384 RepID=A0A2K9ZGF0_RHILE|nr:hypothetical protein [Rhizobium leguminosarum]AUW47332.1 hypothetical protein CUJ84_pRLN3000203 [Rhizobium leguminosarum]